ncbi:MAG: hypothetical protein ACFHWX_08085 [Bacteroidota bacterium]
MVKSHLNYLKRIRLYRSCFFIIMLPGGLFSQGQATKDDPCKQVLDYDWLTVNTCEMPDTKLRSIHATFQLHTNINEYAAMVLDIDAYKEWNKSATNYQLRERPASNQAIFYSEVEAPWPVSNRFGIYHVKVYKRSDEGTLTVISDLKPELMHQQDDFIQIGGYQSKLTIVQIDTNLIEGEFYLTVDPGGSIPDWVTNLSLKTISNNYFLNLKARLEKDTNPKNNEIISRI